MADKNDPLQGLTIDQIDVSDPESRAYVSQYIDFDDKETSSYFKENPVKNSRSLLDRAKDEFKGATATGFPGLVARKAYDWFDIGMDDLKKRFPGKDADWYESTHEKAISQAQRDVLAEADEKARLDPTWRPEEGWLDNALSGRWLATVGGMGAGSAGPEMLIAPGSSALARVAAQGGINAAADLGYQGLEVADEVRDDISLAQAGASGLFGMGAQGVGEGVSKLVGKVAASNGRLSEDAEAFRENLFATGTVDDIMANAPDAKTLDRAAVEAYVLDRDNPKPGVVVDPRTRYVEPTGPMPTVQDELALQGGEVQPELNFTPDGAPVTSPRRRGEGGRFAPTPKQLEMDLPEGVPTPRQEEFEFEQPTPAVRETAIGSRLEEGTDPIVDEVADYATSLKNDWANSPDVDVYPHFDGAEGIDPKVLGAYDPETGGVLLNAKAIADEAKLRGISNQEMTNTVLFHEGLGHYGLAQKFRDDLDGTLEMWYEKSPYFEKKIDEWLVKNDGVYPDEENLIARAGEEILAEMSEKGTIPRKLLDDIKNKIKAYARDFGFDWKVSEREIKTVLSQVHDAVINGNKADVSGNGYRTMLGRNRDIVQKAINDTAAELGIRDVEKALKENDFRAQVKMTLEQRGHSQSLLDKDGASNRLMRSSGSGSEGPLQGKTTRDVKKEGEGKASPIGRVRTKDNVEDIIDTVDVTKTKETFDEWIDEAGRIKMPAKAAAQLAKGTEAPQMLAAREVAAKSANRIKQLQRKIDKGNATVRDMQLFAREVKRLDTIAQSISDVMANAARLLNTGKITVETDKALLDGIRNMLATADLTTPEGIAKAAAQLTKDEKKQKVMKKLLNSYAEILSLPRSLMSSMDLSAPFRQGIFMVSKKNFWKGIPDMFKMFGSRKAFNDLMRGIENHPNHRLMEKSDLALMDLGSNLTKREEDFISSWAEKLPVVGPFVKASGRGYTGFLNKLRADVFNELVEKSKAAGVDFKKDPKALNDIAYYINGATGRGKLPGKWETAAPALAGVLFSPRLMASRIQMLNPVMYARLSPVVRRDAIKTLIASGSIVSIVIGLAALAGADVETDARSSDFAKIKVGKTRYDMLGGFGQYLTLAARIARQSSKNMKGDIKVLGEGYKPDTGLTVMTRFFRTKASPVASYFADMLDGKNVIGEEFHAGPDAIKRFIPMFLSDMGKLVDEYGPVQGPLMSAPGFFGVSTQTYDPPKGNDRLGRSFSTKRDNNDPVAKELDRLEQSLGSVLIGDPQKSVTIDGEKIPLDDEQYSEYTRLAGSWIKEDIEQEMADPEWQTLSDEDKAAIIKAITRDARKDAREELFSAPTE